ncbi:uncharacterized protein [Triticum aestivum]|uniref:uncharacterized protein n=1 Tax=Triticum aestivum TaxID=4565 RepID=UPI001D02B4D2|nr:uncharacterized protein LOC123184138 [Triticum aestivum]
MPFEDIFGEPPSPAITPSSPGTSPSLSHNTTAALSSDLAPVPSAPAPPVVPPADTLLISFHNDHISNHIKFKLDPAENNYIKWRTFFYCVLMQYHVQDHVDRPPPPNPDAAWLAVDHHLTLWLYFTLADSILKLVMGGAVNAFTAWRRIRDYFLANEGAQYLHLTRQFRNLKQGDLSVSDYARRLKALADGLADTGHAVEDHDLTMQLLHGLDARFDTIRTILGDTVPLPPFHVARSRLDLAEYNINLRVAEAGSAALTISGGLNSNNDRGDRGDRGDRADRTDRAPPSDRGSSGNDGRGAGGGDRSGGRGRGRSASGGRGSAPPQSSPWTGYFAPYGMALPAPRSGWVPPNAAGVLEPRPGVHSQAYPLMLSGPSPPPLSTPPYQAGPPSWDHAALFQHAYSQQGLPHHGADWILDSGAATHVTGNPGTSNPDSSSDV